MNVGSFSALDASVLVLNKVSWPCT